MFAYRIFSYALVIDIFSVQGFVDIPDESFGWFVDISDCYFFSYTCSPFFLIERIPE